MSDFRHHHDRYLEAWAEALASGDSACVETWMAPGYHGWFAPTSDEHTPYDRDDAVAGMRASVASLSGSRLRTGHRTVSRRGPDQAVVSYEKLVERDGGAVAGAFVVEAWRRDAGRWLVCRELTEHGATVEEPGAEGGT